MDGRKSCNIKEVLDWYRDEGARDLRRSELNEVVESMTCLNTLEGKNWEVGKSWKSEKSNHNIVMNEKFVKNILMNEQFVKTCVMNAKIDPKVLMDLSMFKIGGWNNLEASNQTLFNSLLMITNRGC